MFETLLKVQKLVSLPPNITGLGEGGGFDDLWSHPGVCPGCAHPGRVIHLPGQTEIRDLHGFLSQVIVFNPFPQQDWKTAKGSIEGHSHSTCTVKYVLRNQRS